MKAARALPPHPWTADRTDKTDRTPFPSPDGWVLSVKSVLSEGVEFSTMVTEVGNAQEVTFAKFGQFPDSGPSI